ncbi:MAG: fibronectin type III domain-containing protein [Patescibacteria group bacterium]|nr:fibronectin type III domain-containing protein [Patescibacteria group bacterium]
MPDHINNISNGVKLKIFITSCLILTLVFSAKQVQAGNIADISFESSPLFGEINIMPGDSVSKWIKVMNKIEGDLAITTKATNVINDDNLGDQMNLTIKKGDSVIYNDTMTAFFNAGNINLGTLGAGEAARFDYGVSFKIQAGDDFAGKTMSFDISVTAQSPESIGGETYTAASSGGGGGGMPYVYGGLIIENQAVALNAQATETSIIITWTTNKPATSRVIYDIVSHPDLTNALPPNYGYAFSTSLDTNKVTGHSVMIDGLTPGTTYYLRTLSSASPEKYGAEIAIATAGAAPIGGGQVLGEKIEGEDETAGKLGIPGIIKGLPQKIVKGIKKIAKEIIPSAPIGEVEEISESENGIVKAGEISPPIEPTAAGVAKEKINKATIFLIIVVICLLGLFFVRFRGREQKNK